MKKIFLLSLLCFLQTVIFASIRRVGYIGNPRAGVDYANFLSAYNASVFGDTIQIYGSVSVSTNGQSISKRLVIIGFGYNFDVNPNLQANGIDAPSSFNGSLVFDLGSDNSVIEGCDFQSGANALDVATSNITIRRCRVPYYGIRLRNDLRSFSNTRIESCVASVQMFSPTSANICTNVQIRNCILYLVNFYQNSSSGTIVNCVTPNTTDGTGNNIQVNLNTASFLVKNCILFSYNSSNVNTIWENNFFGTAQPTVLPSGSNNRWGQTWANLFNRLGGSSDAPGVWSTPSFAENYYVLKNGSQAINGGFDSNNNPTDCGIFGGDTQYRYKLGGVPPIPSIYKLTANSTSANTNPYNVTISVRSNN